MNDPKEVFVRNADPSYTYEDNNILDSDEGCDYTVHVLHAGNGRVVAAQMYNRKKGKQEVFRELVLNEDDLANVIAALLVRVKLARG